MKLSIYRILAGVMLLASTGAMAQTSNAIIFTENGERFTIILNGLRQNDKPETNVKIEGLNANYYKAKVIFEDVALGESNFNLGIESGTETTYIIKKNNKNAYVLRPMSMVPIAQASPSAPSSSVVIYNPNPTPYTGETVTQQTTTTTTTGSPDGTVGINIGMNVSETGGGVSMNMSGMETQGTVVTQQTTTTTVTSTTGGPSSAPPPPPASYLPGYNGPIGCPIPMMPQDFESMKSSINTKSFEESKLTIAKQILTTNCMLASQVKEIMMLFSFEDTRLDYAKYAYGRTYDIGNYFKVNDAFTFESSIDDLNAYLNSFRR